jgi:predicted XRE-type DNA-binding protein
LFRLLHPAILASIIKNIDQKGAYPMGTKSEMLIRVAELYYEQQLCQNDISDILGVSRSSISRMLDEARDAGIVEIIVHKQCRPVIPAPRSSWIAGRNCFFR